MAGQGGGGRGQQAARRRSMPAHGAVSVRPEAAPPAPWPPYRRWSWEGGNCMPSVAPRAAGAAAAGAGRAVSGGGAADGCNR